MSLSKVCFCAITHPLNNYKPPFFSNCQNLSSIMYFLPVDLIRLRRNTGKRPREKLKNKESLTWRHRRWDPTLPSWWCFFVVETLTIKMLLSPVEDWHYRWNWFHSQMIRLFRKVTLTIELNAIDITKLWLPWYCFQPAKIVIIAQFPFYDYWQKL